MVSEVGEAATYALFPCPGVKVLPSSRVTGSKGDPLAKTHLLNEEDRWGR